MKVEFHSLKYDGDSRSEDDSLIDHLWDQLNETARSLGVADDLIEAADFLQLGHMIQAHIQAIRKDIPQTAWERIISAPSLHELDRQIIDGEDDPELN